MNLIVRDVTSIYTSVIFEKKKHCGTLQSKFLIRELFITCNTDRCCEHAAGGVNIYLHRWVSVLTPMCALCLCLLVLCLCLCEWCQIVLLGKKWTQCVKYAAHHPSSTFSRLSICRYIISLSKITNQMWWTRSFV